MMAFHWMNKQIPKFRREWCPLNHRGCCCVQCLENDGLLVLAKGLGLTDIIYKFGMHTRCFGFASNARTTVLICVSVRLNIDSTRYDDRSVGDRLYSSAVSFWSHSLVFVLNLSPKHEQRINDRLQADGVKGRLVSCLIRMLCFTDLESAVLLRRSSSTTKFR